MVSVMAVRSESKVQDKTLLLPGYGNVYIVHYDRGDQAVNRGVLRGKKMVFRGIPDELTHAAAKLTF